MSSALQQFDAIPQTSMISCLLANGDEYVRCSRCHFGGCDVRVEGCGCTLHVRCIKLNYDGPLSSCPICNRPTTGLVLFPMSFREIDDAKKNASSMMHSNGRRNRKRKSAELISSTGEEKGNYVSDRRIGRWTNEEIALCDKLIEKFENGDLPMLDGIKLNDFLGNMLKSKQSRLTKKMKNAKLSSKTFERSLTYNSDVVEVKEFSELEESFFHAIQCQQERAEIKFHMQKEWRELFSNLCIHIGQPLDADAWLCSVEEMDRRASHAKEAARMARRKLMTGFALRHDAQNSDTGVFIEHADEGQLIAEESAAAMILGAEGADTHDVLALLADKSMLESTKPLGGDCNVGSSLLHSAPFLSRALSYMHRHHVPFEHVDLWVPSFVTHSSNGQMDNSTSCRLCYAGNATVEIQVGPDGKSSIPLSAEESFNLSAFGDYSQKFSFDVGCGLPGRVYQSGMPTWEQNVMNAPHNHFERGGGARQWGIKTVVGIPISSPSVGRIVVTLYSRHDREKDQELVGRLSDEFTRLMPSPKWKLVVDIGEPEPASPNMQTHTTVQQSASNAVGNTHSFEHESRYNGHEIPDSREEKYNESVVDQVISLLGEFMPSDASSPLASLLPGFMSLRLMLLRPTKTTEEEDIMRTMLGSYASYSAGGRTKSDIAIMLARDFMFLIQQHTSIQPPRNQFMGQSTLNHSQHYNTSNSGFSVFNFGSSSDSQTQYHDSPALAPIPLSGNVNDSISIVSM